MKAIAGTLPGLAARVLAAAALTAAVLAVPAYSQEDKPALTRRSDAQKQEDADIDKAYRAATKGELAPTVKKDPWRTVRPAETADKTKQH